MKQYFVGYLTDHGDYKTCMVKAFNQKQAEKKIYRKHKNGYVVVKIALI